MHTNLESSSKKIITSEHCVYIKLLSTYYVYYYRLTTQYMYTYSHKIAFITLFN